MAPQQKFNWEAFFRDNGISFTSHIDSKNVAKGWLGIQCPFCGSSDHADHMGVRISGTGYSCWRNSSHRGGQPQKLIMQLLGCDYSKAEQVAQFYGVSSKPSDLLKAVQQLSMSPGAVKTSSLALQWPEHFRPLAGDHRSAAKAYREYLMWERKFQYPEDVDLLAEKFDLRYTLSGYWSGKILLPVFNLQNQMVTWTGRQISAKARTRFVSLSPKEEKKEEQEGYRAVLPITDCLGGRPWALEGKALILVEGPIDMLKLDLYGEMFGVKSTCLFGKVISKRQFQLLRQIASLYKHRYLLLDKDTGLEHTKFLNQLSPLGFQLAPQLPEGVGDAGDFTPEQALEYCAELTSMVE